MHQDVQEAYKAYDIARKAASTALGQEAEAETALLDKVVEVLGLQKGTMLIIGTDKACDKSPIDLCIYDNDDPGPPNCLCCDSPWRTSKVYPSSKLR
jgi:hypothetical protein